MLWIAFVALASAKDPCRELKPREKIDPAAIELARSAVQIALSAAPVPGAAGVVATLPPTATLSSALGGSPGARSQALYEICRLKEIGMLSPQKAEELTAAVLTGEKPAPPAPVRSFEDTLRRQAAEQAQQIQAQARAEIVELMELYCGMSGMEAACEMYKASLAAFDKNSRLVDPFAR